MKRAGLHNSIIRTSGLEVAIEPDMPKEKIVPIKNIPPTLSEPDAISSKEVFEIYRLRRRLAEQIDDNRSLSNKISEALTLIRGTIRFFELGLLNNQWETYDELMRRKQELKGLAAR